MIERLQLRIKPKHASDQFYIFRHASIKLNIERDRIKHIETIKRSIDARKIPIMVNLQVDVYIDEEYKEVEEKILFPNVANKEAVIVVGAGPAGLFAALELIQQGKKPIVIERGQEISQRKRDIAKMFNDNSINIDSNYCYGEGGAGTFSDGKLYTRSKKKGDVKKILKLLVHHGADKNILVESHPHIGTNRLPGIIKAIRETILNSGGEVHFNKKMTEIIIRQKQVKGIRCDEEEFLANNLILATGHSARDVYNYLHKHNVKLELKGFAAGVRIEHPQNRIDKIQYRSTEGRGEYLPPAEYSIVQQIEGRGVYSFCMCPGGIIVPASTNHGETVVNGMSNSKRSSQWANSGFVVEIRPEDLKGYEKYGPMAGIKFQKHLEKLCFDHSGEGMIAPSQRLIDFVNKEKSTDLPETSYIPGVRSSDMHNWMPEHINERMRKALKFFGKKMRGFLTDDAIMIGVESRTSSPVRIPRNKENLEHIEIKGLYPCGEGAGYSGGIVSSAIDGQRCAAKI